MRAAGLPEVAIASFAHYYRQVQDGQTGLVPEASIEPAGDLPSARDLVGSSGGTEALSRTVVIKLNGGLGTGMGMTHAKSLLPVKGRLNFLDVIVRQTLALRERHGCRLPLVLMNSFRTHADSIDHLQAYPSLAVEGVALDFLQHKVPRIRSDDFQPLQWPDDPESEWCPPGHGDLYAAMTTSGVLDNLLAAGFEFAFVSNGDNLGALLALDILDWFAEQELTFLMEVAERTDSDRKGGHLARYRNGSLVLRESAQCAAEEAAAFQDIERYRFFNTNNLWLNLRAVKAELEKHSQVLPLPLIRNQKRVVATDEATPLVFQTETAMGAAISVFERTGAIRVGRERFAPVKTTNDLLLLWSTCYQLDAHYCLLPTRPQRRAPQIDLDPRYFSAIVDFERRFSHGAPDLTDATAFRVSGDVWFENNVTVRGSVSIVANAGERLTIAAGTVLEG